MTRRRHAPDLAELLAALAPPAPPQPDTLLQPQAGLVARHLWLMGLLAWVRGAQDSVPAALDRLGLFIEAVQARPPLRARLQACWALLLETVDVTTLLADFGFAPRTALLSELGARLRERLLPHSPETIDAAELFALALPGAFDAQVRDQGLETGLETLPTERRKGGRALEDDHVRGSRRGKAGHCTGAGRPQPGRPVPGRDGPGPPMVQREPPAGAAGSPSSACSSCSGGR